MTQLESARRNLTLYEAVVEPDPETLLDLFDIHKTESGKFVRIGKLVLIAPFMEFGSAASKPLQHKDIIPTALEGPDTVLAKRVQDALQVPYANIEEPVLEDTVHDAGTYNLVVFSNKIQAMDIGHYSLKFGRADADGRQQTIETFQTYMGPDVPVYAAG